jgi:putative membrane protein
MMWWYGNGMNAWGYTLMTVSMMLFWGLVIFGVIASVRYLARWGPVNERTAHC